MQAAGRARRTKPASASPTRRSTAPSPASPSRTASRLEQLRQQLARDGITYAEFRNSIRDETHDPAPAPALRAEPHLGQRSRRSTPPLAAQAERGVQFHLAHILVALPEGATPEQIATAQEEDRRRQGPDRHAARWTSPPPRCAIPTAPTRWKAATWAGAASTRFPPRSPTLMREHEARRRSSRPVRGPSGFQLVQAGRSARRRAGRSRRMVTAVPRAPHPGPHRRRRRPTPRRKAKIDTLRARIAGGADFAEVAKENSEDASSQGKGGDLGWFAPDAFGTGVRRPGRGAAATARCPQPFQTEAGWHIVAARRHAPDRRQRREPPRTRCARPSAAASSRTSGTATCARCAARPIVDIRGSATEPSRPSEAGQRPPTAAEHDAPSGSRWSRASRPASGRNCACGWRSSRADCDADRLRRSPTRLHAAADALGLPLRLLRAEATPRTPGELALVADPQRRRPRLRRARPAQRRAP